MFMFSPFCYLIFSLLLEMRDTLSWFILVGSGVVILI